VVRCADELVTTFMAKRSLASGRVAEPYVAEAVAQLRRRADESAHDVGDVSAEERATPKSPIHSCKSSGSE
jgi:hypothetical protein